MIVAAKCVEAAERLEVASDLRANEARNEAFEHVAMLAAETAQRTSWVQSKFDAFVDGVCAGLLGHPTGCSFIGPHLINLAEFER